MKRVFFPARVIITMYGSLLLLLAFFFLMRDNSVHRLESALPLSFILRFCTFWFISIVFAIVFFVVNLNVNYFTTVESDRIKARRAGLLAVALAALGTIVAVAAVYFFRF